ncbi:hypothetical protein [Mycoplasma parvum]|uniref:Uncharacterized protein n=1 Tax=Mycoplasma parvum str. Indiana TaxID=1403316 RepID=U5NG73_9MOLU|nr:hypothetical protein [Mycoplasma parvum]AGX89268.1 hypothetical protein PRV_02700 [Mycoplasma parvum str. Indiana]
MKEKTQKKLKNGLTISGNAIFEKIKNCDELKEIEEEKLKNGCVYLDCKMMKKFKKFKSLKESFNLFDENESANSGIRKNIWLSLLTGIDSPELELKRENFEFVYNCYKKLFLKRPVWFDRQPTSFI